MNRDPDVGLPTLLRRAARKRCPRCGVGRVMATWGRHRTHCDSCGFKFEREPGYFVGAMVINTAVTIGLMMGSLALGAVVFWPDVPWVALFVTTVVIAGATPVLFYPLSKTFWMAVEISYHRLEESERLAAMERVEESQ